MKKFLDLNRYPLDQPDSEAYGDLVNHCRADLARSGTFSLDGFLRPVACENSVREIAPAMASESFEHRRKHNVYFLDSVPGLDPDHPVPRASRLSLLRHRVGLRSVSRKLSRLLEEFRFAPMREVLGLANPGERNDEADRARTLSRAR